MSDEKFDVLDNFKRRYAALKRLQQYIRKWENTEQVRFTNREQQALHRMVISLERNLSKLQEEFILLYKDKDIKCLEKYIKNDNGNKNK